MVAKETIEIKLSNGETVIFDNSQFNHEEILKEDFVQIYEKRDGKKYLHYFIKYNIEKITTEIEA